MCVKQQPDTMVSAYILNFMSKAHIEDIVSNSFVALSTDLTDGTPASEP